MKSQFTVSLHRIKFFWLKKYQIINASFVLSLHALEKDNMKSVLSQHSGIPEENVEFAKVNFLNYIFAKLTRLLTFTSIWKFLN